METKMCRHCGRGFTERQSSGDTCFRCKATSIGFSWRGPTAATRKNFHDHTIADIHRESVDNYKQLNPGKDESDFKKDYTPVGNRWV